MRVKNNSSLAKCYWTKYDQTCLEDGRRRVIEDKLNYYPFSYEANRFIREIINRVSCNKPQIKLSARRLETAVDSVRNYLYRPYLKERFLNDETLSDYIKNGAGDIDDLFLNLLKEYIEKTIEAVTNEARCSIKQMIRKNIQSGKIIEVIRKELCKTHALYTNRDTGPVIDLALSFLEKSDTQRTILNDVMQCYIFGEDVKTSSKYCIAVKKAIRETIVSYIFSIQTIQRYA